MSDKKKNLWSDDELKNWKIKRNKVITDLFKADLPITLLVPWDKKVGDEIVLWSTASESAYPGKVDDFKQVGKRPLHSAWQSTKLTNTAIKAILSANPNSNVGLSMGERSGIICIDIDIRNGGGKFLELHRELLDQAIPELTRPNGQGYHFFFKYAPGIESHSKFDEFPGVEIKSNGTQVVMAPSVHPETLAPYKLSYFDCIAEALPEKDDEGELVEPPGELFEILGVKKKRGPGRPKKVSEQRDFVRAVTLFAHRGTKLEGNLLQDLEEARDRLKDLKSVQGKRGNETVFKAGCIGCDHGIPFSVWLDELKVWDKENSVPPWTTDKHFTELFEIAARNGYRYAHNKPGCRSDALLFSEAGGDEKDKDENPKQQEEKSELGYRNKKLKLWGSVYLHYFPNTLHHHDIIFQYNEDRKCWQALTAIELRANIRSHVREISPSANYTQTNVKNATADVVLECTKKRQGQNIEMNSWLVPGKPKKCIGLKNGILDIEKGVLLDHSPEWFSTERGAFEFNPDADCSVWKEFLASSLEEDEEKITALQTFFGYCLDSDTSRKKGLLLMGLRDSGKSIISDILEVIIGSSLTCKTDLKELSGDFGGQHIPGKKLVVVREAEGELKNVSVALNRLKQYTGNDGMVCNRKGLPIVHAPTIGKVVITSNELPKVRDTAFMNRFLTITFERSFTGREDHNLKDKLLAELPGILNWTLEGFRKLQEDGLIEPASSREAKGEHLRESSLIYRYAQDHFKEAYEYDLDPQDNREVIYRDRVPFSPYVHNHFASWLNKQDIEIRIDRLKFFRELKPILLDLLIGAKPIFKKSIKFSGIDSGVYRGIVPGDDKSGFVMLELRSSYEMRFADEPHRFN